MAGRDILIIGHGAYAVENARSGVEYGALSIAIICGHQHVAVPRCLTWLLDAGRPSFSADGIPRWLEAARLPAAYATIGMKRPAASDLYYVAMRHGRVSVVRGCVTASDSKE